MALRIRNGEKSLQEELEQAQKYSQIKGQGLLPKNLIIEHEKTNENSLIGTDLPHNDKLIQEIKHEHIHCANQTL